MKWFFLTKQIYEIVKFWCLVSLISLTVHFEQLFEADHLKNVKLWKNLKFFFFFCVENLICEIVGNKFDF